MDEDLLFEQVDSLVVPETLSLLFCQFYIGCSKGLLTENNFVIYKSIKKS